jgi:glycosyltransferase involved in cell wall biosynthesis
LEDEMKLTVLNVAYPLAPVGRDAVGGAEQVLTELDGILMRAGHRSAVVACEGSEVRGELLKVPRLDRGLTEGVKRLGQAHHRAAIELARSRWGVDLIHMHGFDFHTYLPGPGIPVLVTLHLPLDWYPPCIFDLGRPETYFVCVSRSQQVVGPNPAGKWPVVENGVPMDRYSWRHTKRNFALMLGRICPEKGFHLGLEAARRAGMPAVVGGKVFGYEAHEKYFCEEIVPRLDRWRRFAGALGFERKRRLLAAARCLLVPSLAPETSSLVAMESLACGTPVIAFASGALREIVEDGKTGFLVKNEMEMARALKRVSVLRPEDCRESARARFSGERMGRNYLEIYEGLARGIGLGREQPQSLEEGGNANFD